MIKVAVIGLSHPHILTMIEEILDCPQSFKIVAICDDPSAPAHVEKAMQLVPSAALYPKEDAVFEKADFDAVMSSAIFSQKSDLAVKTLQHGKHLMFDKPLAITIEGIHQIEDALKKHPDLKIALWLTERYSSTYFTAKHLIDMGEIGEIVHMNFIRPHRLAPHTRPYWHLDATWYGGILSDIGVHDIDLARWFSKSECQSIEGVHVSTKRFKEYNINDNGIATLVMKSGATCSLFENWLTPDQFPIHGDTRAILYGTKGQIEVKAYPESVILCTDTKRPYEVDLLKPSCSSVEDFANVLLQKDYQPIINTKDAILSTKLAIQVQNSAQ